MLDSQLYEKEGLTVVRCFPDSFKRAPLQDQSGDTPTDAELMVWENYNIAIECQEPFAVLMFPSRGDWQDAISKDPIIGTLTAVKNPDNSVSCWFSWPRWEQGHNGVIEDLGGARLICRNYLVPAPPSSVGNRECEVLYQTSPLLETWDPDPGSVKYAQTKPFALQAISLSGMMAFAPPEQPSYIAGGLMDSQGKMIIGGIPKAGKSRLGANLAFSLATGQPFLGFQTMQYPRVLMLQFEVSERRFRERVTSIAKAWKIPVDNPLPLYFLTVSGLALDQKGGIAELRRLIKTFAADVVILDPLSKIHTLAENEQKEMLGLFNSLDDLIDELQISIVLLHHMKKPSNNSTGDDLWASLRGSSQISAWADTMLLLHKPTHDAKPLVRSILRNGEEWTKAITFNADHTIEVIGDIMSAIEGDIQAACYRHAGESRKNIAARISKSWNLDISEVYAIMKGMEAKGISLPK